MGKYQPFNGIKQTGNDWTVTINEITVPFKRIPVEMMQEIMVRFPEFDPDSKTDKDEVGGDRMLGFQCAIVAAATNRSGSEADRRETELDLFDHGDPADITVAFFNIMRKTVKNFDSVYKDTVKESGVDPMEAGGTAATPPARNRQERRAQASRQPGSKRSRSASSETSATSTD